MQEIQKFEPGKGIWLCRQKMTFFVLNDWHEAMEGLRNFIALVSWVPIRQLWVWNHKCIGTYSFLDSLVGVLQITFNHVVFTVRLISSHFKKTFVQISLLSKIVVLFVLICIETSISLKDSRNCLLKMNGLYYDYHRCSVMQGRSCYYYINRQCAIRLYNKAVQ